MADNFSQGKPHSGVSPDIDSKDYQGPGRHVSSSSDSKLPLHNSGQLDDTASPTKQNASDHSGGKSTQGISDVIEKGKASYEGPGRIHPRNVGDTSNQPK